MKQIIRTRVRELLSAVGTASRPLVQAWNVGARLKCVSVLSSPASHVFFGYYDQSPFGEDARRILSVRTNHPLASPAPGSRIDVGYFDLDREEKGFIKVAESGAWCWQQACRLCWFPSHGPSKNIFFNTFEHQRYVGRIVALESGDVIGETDIPLYDTSRCGRYGLSLNFSRLQRLRPGYGYTSLPDATERFKIPPDDGIFLYDFRANRADFILSYEAIVQQVAPPAGWESMDHYINHLSFSPSGDRFLFLYLMSKGKKRITRLLVCNRDGSDLRLLNRGGVVSHYAWDGDSMLLVYCTSESLGRMCYQMFDLEGGGSRVVAPALEKDGHPSLVRGGDVMVTDTYPSRMGYQSLIVHDMRTDKPITRLPLHRARKFHGEWRTDLHPRVSADERHIAVDDEQDGYKAMRIFHVQYD